jgi:DAACS family dicarboxylate/amino acid:cation (Na+ or H+) symporter
VAQPVGQIFLRLLFMLVVPLLFSALVLGVTGLGDLRHLGRVGAKTLAYTVFVSTIAVLLGVTLVNLLRPGDGISPEMKARLAQGRERARGARDGHSRAQERPRSRDPDRAGQPAQGGGQRRLPRDHVLRPALRGRADPDARGGRARLTEVLEGLYGVTMRLIEMVISLAPIGSSPCSSP